MSKAKPKSATFIQPATWHKQPRGYSNGVVLPPGRPLFIAGMIGWNEQEDLIGPGMAEQFRQALLNVRTVAEAAGSGVKYIGRLTIYVTDKQAYVAARKEIGAAYKAVFGSHYPAMALIGVTELVDRGAIVEIEADAMVPSERS